VIVEMALALALYADPSHTPAAHQAKVYAAHNRPKDARLMRAMSKVPQGFWISGPAPRRAVARIVKRAGAKTPVLVAYDLPRRHCRAKGYQRWIGGFAKGIGSHRAIVILEPDALPSGCGAGALRGAMARLERLARARVYVDAGHSAWQSAATMATRLENVHARAFALNVSNFRRTSEVTEYGEQVSELMGGAHFVIDTSRNGRGPFHTEWCNPPRRGLGPRPTTDTGNPLVDAYLWIKVPGESDGTCRHGPTAGAWWPAYALGLARRANPPLR
jgi:endoglucanase